MHFFDCSIIFQLLIELRFSISKKNEVYRKGRSGNKKSLIFSVSLVPFSAADTDSLSALAYRLNFENKFHDDSSTYNEKNMEISPIGNKFIFIGKIGKKVSDLASKMSSSVSPMNNRGLNGELKMSSKSGPKITSPPPPAHALSSSTEPSFATTKSSRVITDKISFLFSRHDIMKPYSTQLKDAHGIISNSHIVLWKDEMTEKATIKTITQILSNTIESTHDSELLVIAFAHSTTLSKVESLLKKEELREAVDCNSLSDRVKLGILY